jgi:hypothetical protein
LNMHCMLLFNDALFNDALYDLVAHLIQCACCILCFDGHSFLLQKPHSAINT